MSFVQVKSGKVILYRDNGTHLRDITTGAISADINCKEDLILVTKTNGKVELRRENGTLIRTM